jgi:hypothetical protein
MALGYLQCAAAGAWSSVCRVCVCVERDGGPVVQWYRGWLLIVVVVLLLPPLLLLLVAAAVMAAACRIGLVPMYVCVCVQARKSAVCPSVRARLCVSC